MQKSLTSLKSDAKRLKKAFDADDLNARHRVETVLNLKMRDTGSPLRHADCLHIIARENGFDSWPKLKFAVEAEALTRDERADRLKRALYFGQHWVTEKLLTDDPGLAHHNFALELALYDVEAVRARLKNTPSAAIDPVGPRSPILHLAFSKHIHGAPEKQVDMIALADLLIANGADVNDAYASEPGSDHTVSALYGALGHADNMPLAQWFLENGADPNDNESLYHATELGHHHGLKLLMQHGVRTSGTNALPRALDFNDLAAVKLLLEHGADPNEAVGAHPSGQPVDSIPALHQAARRWCTADIVALLLSHGADPRAVWEGHTPYALARIFGNQAMVGVLEDAGAQTSLSPSEVQLAACAEAETPELVPGSIDPQTVSSEDRRLLTRLVWSPTPLSHIKCLVIAGLNPDEPDEMGLPPLHIAGWEGLPERLAYFLTLSPDLTYVNGYGGDALETVIHGSEFCPNAEDRDHVTCAELLLKAGATLTQRLIDGCGNETLALFLESWSADANAAVQSP